MVTPASLKGETGLCCAQYLVTHTLAQISFTANNFSDCFYWNKSNFFVFYCRSLKKSSLTNADHL